MSNPTVNSSSIINRIKTLMNTGDCRDKRSSVGIDNDSTTNFISISGTKIECPEQCKDNCNITITQTTSGKKVDTAPLMCAINKYLNETSNSDQMSKIKTELDLECNSKSSNSLAVNNSLISTCDFGITQAANEQEQCGINFFVNRVINEQKEIDSMTVGDIFFKLILIAVIFVIFVILILVPFAKVNVYVRTFLLIILIACIFGLQKL